jgi:hypothetical protein
MLLKSILVLTGAVRSLAVAVPQSSYEYPRPLVSSKPLQDLVTTEG